MSRLLALALVLAPALAGCGGAPDAPGPLDCGLAPLVFDARGDVVQGESDDGCVRIERREVPLEEGFLCKACPYEPLRLVAHLEGVDVDTSALSYEATHHNWADVVSATDAELSVRILYSVDDGGWDLEVDLEDGALLLPVVGSR